MFGLNHMVELCERLVTAVADCRLGASDQLHNPPTSWHEKLHLLVNLLY